MHFKQKLVTGRRQNDIKAYSAKHSASIPILNRLQQEYQLNKENQPSDRNRFQDQTHHQKNQYGFYNAERQLNEMKNSKSGRILIQDEHTHHIEHQTTQHRQTLRPTNQRKDCRMLYDKFVGSNVYEDTTNIQRNQYIDQICMVRSVEKAPAQTFENPLSHAKKLQLRRRKDTNRKHSRYESVDLEDDCHRPLTFGLIQNCSMVKSQNWQHPNHALNQAGTEHVERNTKCSLINSKQYIQQKQIKEEVLDEIMNRNSIQRGRIMTMQSESFADLSRSQEYVSSSTILKSQQNTLISSVQGSILNSMSESLRNNNMTNSINPVSGCSNHPTKRAKYLLINSEQQMLYCSKCAINLLQQGFKVEELKKDLRIRVHSQLHTESDSMNVQLTRTRELQEFQDKINQTQQTLRGRIQELQIGTEVQFINEHIESVKRLFQNIACNLGRIRQKEINELEQARTQANYHNSQFRTEFLSRLGSLKEIKKQLNQYRVKFIQMNQNQYQFLLESFLNKVRSYQQQSNLPKRKIASQFDTQNKIEHVIAELYHRLNDRRGAQISFEKKTEQEQSVDYYCEETKQPFRSLFHDQDDEKAQRSKRRSISSRASKDSPTFKKCGRT